MPFKYALHPFVWRIDEGLPRHDFPTGARAVFDFRLDSEVRFAGQTTRNTFFAWPDTYNLPSEAIFLAQGYISEIQATPSMRQLLQTNLGLSAQPSGATLCDCIADSWLALSDPSGQSAVTTLNQCNNQFELHLAEHSLVWREAFDISQITKNANPVGKYNRVRDLIRRNMQIAFDSGGESLLAKVLGTSLLQGGYKHNDFVNAAKRVEWLRLISPQLQQRLASDFKPVKPGTVYSESFPTTSNDLEADYATWKTLAIDSFADTVKVSAIGRAYPSSGFSNKCAVYKTAVSSANHTVAASVAAYLGYNGPFSRASETAGTGYLFASRGASGSRNLIKIVAGTWTSLDLVATNPNGVYQIDSNGSTQTGKCAGQSDRTVTDSSITGNLKGGFVLYHDTGSEMASEMLYSWSIDDHVSPYNGSAATTIVGLFTGYAPTLAYGLVLTAATTGAGTFTSSNATAVYGITQSANTPVTALFEGYAPTITYGVVNSSTTGQAITEGYLPLLIVGEYIPEQEPGILSGETGLGIVEGYAPTVEYGIGLAAATTVVALFEGYTITLSVYADATTQCVIDLYYIGSSYEAESIVAPSYSASLNAAPTYEARAEILRVES